MQKSCFILELYKKVDQKADNSQRGTRLGQIQTEIKRGDLKNEIFI